MGKIYEADFFRNGKLIDSREIEEYDEKLAWSLFEEFGHIRQEGDEFVITPQEKPVEIMPYNKCKVEGAKYWDYSFKIKGIIYEVSVNQKTGKMYLCRDEHQGL